MWRAMETREDGAGAADGRPGETRTATDRDACLGCWTRTTKDCRPLAAIGCHWLPLAASHGGCHWLPLQLASRLGAFVSVCHPVRPRPSSKSGSPCRPPSLHPPSYPPPTSVDTERNSNNDSSSRVTQMDTVARGLPAEQDTAGSAGSAVSSLEAVCRSESWFHSVTRQFHETSSRHE
ncbi:hypothetical protein BV25DRAFT_311931 [Artomyces pyxidatus]|uniref:Uncharacterized protein n=1 Tax=Artomyces pyxidatus TaxID=48021 RepID=A0ACB8T6G4_9AGAM|nr:hypothetical protein BV25DRAFT_311931 [Artomyces pyxidatus]